MAAPPAVAKNPSPPTPTAPIPATMSGAASPAVTPTSVPATATPAPAARYFRHPHLRLFSCSSASAPALANFALSAACSSSLESRASYVLTNCLGMSSQSLIKNATARERASYSNGRSSLACWVLGACLGSAALPSSSSESCLSLIPRHVSMSPAYILSGSLIVSSDRLGRAFLSSTSSSSPRLHRSICRIISFADSPYGSVTRSAQSEAGTWSHSSTLCVYRWFHTWLSSTSLAAITHRPLHMHKAASQWLLTLSLGSKTSMSRCFCNGCWNESRYMQVRSGRKTAARRKSAGRKLAASYPSLCTCA
ncbi:hypothetical protein GQ54DRAFT_81749 [Martensiomyces pterosporus]|nr:hypothetical protein GQ54DRAFT_81749 [Martensiomyces pterosporus]